MLGVPLEILIGKYPDVSTTAEVVAAQWVWAVAMLAIAAFTWHRGVRRFEAYGA